MASNSTNAGDEMGSKLMYAFDAPYYVCDAVYNRKSLYSNGLFYNDNPLGHTIPLFMLHIGTIILLSHLLHILLRRFRQPRIVSDILGGVLMGPMVAYLLDAFLTESAISRIVEPRSSPDSPDWLELRRKYMETVFPPDNVGLIRTFAAYALMLKLFLIGVKTDPTIVLRTGKKALVIGICNKIVPFIFTGPLAYWLRDVAVLGDRNNRYSHTAVEDKAILPFLMASTSTTFFPVLSDILSEIGLLNTELGRLSMSASLINDIFGWIILFTFGATSQSKDSPINGIYVIVSFLLMLLIIVTVFRRWVLRIIKNTANGAAVNDFYIISIMICVILAGLVSDATGCTYVTGPILMGLVIPDGPPLGTLLVDKLDLIVTEVLMPLIFLDSGMSIDFMTVPLLNIWPWFQFLVILSFVLKFVATMVPALYFKTPLINAAMLGLMANFKGLFELILFLDMKSEHVISTATYTNIILINIIITAICVPLVSIFYDPMKINYRLGNRTIQHLKSHAEFRILISVPSEEAVPTMINVLEVSCGNQQNPMCVYTLHLENMEGRASSSLIAHKNKKGYINPSNMDRLLNAFINYEQIKKGEIVVLPYTAIAPYKVIHQDICSLAAEKNVALIIMPFPRKDPDGLTEAQRAIQNMVSPVISVSPCSLGILIHHSHSSSLLLNPSQFNHRIHVFFWGGPDDREALSYATRMTRHPGVYTKVTRFITPAMKNVNVDRDQAWDDELFMEFKVENSNNERTIIEEVSVNDVEQTVGLIRAIDKNCDLVVVGKHQRAAVSMTEGLLEWAEHPELGVVGDMLVASDFDDCLFSVLVIQQHQHRRS